MKILTAEEARELADQVQPMEDSMVQQLARRIQTAAQRGEHELLIGKIQCLRIQLRLAAVKHIFEPRGYAVFVNADDAIVISWKGKQP